MSEPKYDITVDFSVKRAKQVKCFTEEMMEELDAERPLNKESQDFYDMLKTIHDALAELLEQIDE